METLFLSNWQHEKYGNRISDPATMADGEGGDQVVRKGEMESKKAEDKRMRNGTPYYKRRRVRGGMPPQGGIRPQPGEA